MTTMTLRNFLTGRNSRQGIWWIPLLLAFVGSALLLATSNDFATASNLLNLTSQAMPIIIVSIGQMVVILLGGLDLSVGSVISLTTVILASTQPVYVLIPVALLAAMVVGLVNGVVITRFAVNPIIATLSTQMLVEGIARLIRPVAGGSVSPFIEYLVAGRLLGVPMPLVWGVAVVAVAWKMIHGSKFGFRLFVVGGGVASGRDDAVRALGIAVQRKIVAAYILCSLFAAVSGLFLAGRITSGDANLGPPFALDSITAVALGGTQLAGGIGSLQGTVIGALLMALLANGMNIVNISAFMQTGIKGVVLLMVVVVQRRKKMGL